MRWEIVRMSSSRTRRRCSCRSSSPSVGLVLAANLAAVTPCTSRCFVAQCTKRAACWQVVGQWASQQSR